MEFTKEQIETAGELYSIWNKGIGIPDSETFSEFLDSLLKPKTKKIVVEIEYDADKITFEMNDHAIRNILKWGCSDEKPNWKVAKLPEVFTREDMIKFANYDSDYPEFLTVNNFENWLSERNKNLNKK